MLCDEKKDEDCILQSKQDSEDSVERWFSLARRDFKVILGGDELTEVRMTSTGAKNQRAAETNRKEQF